MVHLIPDMIKCSIMICGVEKSHVNKQTGGRGGIGLDFPLFFEDWAPDGCINHIQIRYRLEIYEQHFLSEIEIYAGNTHSRTDWGCDVIMPPM